MLGQYMGRVERQTYESRARLDSGVGDCEGYLDMTSTRWAHRTQAPPPPGSPPPPPPAPPANPPQGQTRNIFGTINIFSCLRSRTVSKSSASSYLPSATASPRYHLPPTSGKLSPSTRHPLCSTCHHRTGRAIYWSNYKIMNSLPQVRGLASGGGIAGPGKRGR